MPDNLADNPAFQHVDLNDRVELDRFEHLYEAELACGLLRSNGIACEVSSQLIPGVPAEVILWTAGGMPNSRGHSWRTRARSCPKTQPPMNLNRPRAFEFWTLTSHSTGSWETFSPGVFYSDAGEAREGTLLTSFSTCSR